MNFLPFLFFFIFPFYFFYYSYIKFLSSLSLLLLCWVAPRGFFYFLRLALGVQATHQDTLLLPYPISFTYPFISDSAYGLILQKDVGKTKYENGQYLPDGSSLLGKNIPPCPKLSHSNIVIKGTDPFLVMINHY